MQVCVTRQSGDAASSNSCIFTIYHSVALGNQGQVAQINLRSQGGVTG
jgi:hypothetical protein